MQKYPNNGLTVEDELPQQLNTKRESVRSKMGSPDRVTSQKRSTSRSLVG